MEARSNNGIQVSICCVVYNHEKYLRQCIESFLMQKTNFKFEVLIHDDASTDNSGKIIREYEMKYPHIVKGIFEQDNLYSRGLSSVKPLYSAARGKYIAVCEGDDYWTDPNKLQLQYDALEKHLDCHFSAHIVRNVTESGEPTEQYYRIESIRQNGVVSSEMFIRAICEQYCIQTSSWFVRAKDLKDFVEHEPEYAKKYTEIGDEQKCLYFGSLGNVYYFNRCMSERRLFSDGSWTMRHRDMSISWTLKRYEGMEEMMRSYDAYTNGRFHEICQKRIDGFVYAQFGLLCANKQYRKLWNKKFKPYRRQWSKKYYVLAIIRTVVA